MMSASSFVIIKQDAVKRNLAGFIMDIFLKQHTIVRAHLKQLTEQEARELYIVHADKPFYNDLVAFMINGPSVILLLRNNLLTDSEAAVSLVRKIVSEIREDFGTSVRANCIHASDSVEAVIRESAIFFSPLRKQVNDEEANIL